MAIPVGDSRRDPEVRNHYMYRYFDADGRLLYVGCSMRPRVRWEEHKSWRPQMTSQVARVRLVGPLNYDTARAIEKAAIETESPVFGMTPEKYAVRRCKSKYTNQRYLELVADGLSWPTALRHACHEAEEIYGAEVA